MFPDRSPPWEEAGRRVEPAIDVWREADRVVVALDGEHDMGTQAALASRFTELCEDAAGPTWWWT